MDAYKESIIIILVLVITCSLILISTENLLISCKSYTFGDVIFIKISISVMNLIILTAIDIV
jgi:hypothetical protein